MALASLKQLALRRIGNPAFYKRLKTLGHCPYDLIEPVLRQMTFHQLLTLEANTPHLELYTQPLWKMHTLKIFPTVVDTHDTESADAQDADWRLVFHELQEERREREEHARNKLKANYNQIASGKSDRKIQVIKKPAPNRSQIRASITKTPLGLTARNSSTILGKALKASIASTLRTPSPRSVNKSIRPSPNSSPASVGALRTANNSPKKSYSHGKPTAATDQQVLDSSQEEEMTTHESMTLSKTMVFQSLELENESDAIFLLLLIV